MLREVIKRCCVYCFNHHTYNEIESRLVFYFDKNGNRFIKCKESIDLLQKDLKLKDEKIRSIIDDTNRKLDLYNLRLELYLSGYLRHSGKSYNQKRYIERSNMYE